MSDKVYNKLLTYLFRKNM